MTADETLMEYYSLNHQLMYRFKYSLADVEGMIPFEAEIYASMVIADLKKKLEAGQQQSYE